MAPCPYKQPSEIEIIHAGPNGRFHNIQIEFVMCAIDDDGKSGKQRSQTAGLARISRGVRHARAAIAPGDVGRRRLVVICDEYFILAARLEQITDNDASNCARTTQDNEARSGPQYHPMGRSLRLI